jgi:hypothetical protein
MNRKPMVTILIGVLAAGLASAQSRSTTATKSAPTTTKTASSHAKAAPNIKAPATPQTAPPASTAARIAVKAVPPVANPAVAKHPVHERRVRAILVAPSVLPAPVAAPQESAPVPAPAEANVAGSGLGENAANDQAPVPDSHYSANGRRDPFLSPVVSHEGGSGCSTGKKCLEIGNINLRGVVRTESGFIAVVSNNMNKAYFLRENDPVFNGYVVKITGDSIVFQETLQDRLGKSFTREVVKKITTPAV